MSNACVEGTVWVMANTLVIANATVAAQLGDTAWARDHALLFPVPLLKLMILLWLPCGFG